VVLDQHVHEAGEAIAVVAGKRLRDVVDHFREQLAQPMGTGRTDLGQFERVPASVAEITATFDESGCLQDVDHADHVARIEAGFGADALLGHRLAAVDGEHHPDAAGPEAGFDGPSLVGHADGDGTAKQDGQATQVADE
jgi:hypothetical protein